ncbi:MAG: hypothetical protein J5822_04350, partial [Eubacteriaceae bacterium]|nr:hypothetical protein [Eubacteriaceae bacterium]
ALVSDTVSVLIIACSLLAENIMRLSRKLMKPAAVTYRRIIIQNPGNVHRQFSCRGQKVLPPVTPG